MSRDQRRLRQNLNTRRWLVKGSNHWSLILVTSQDSHVRSALCFRISPRYFKNSKWIIKHVHQCLSRLEKRKYCLLLLKRAKKINPIHFFLILFFDEMFQESFYSCRLFHNTWASNRYSYVSEMIDFLFFGVGKTNCHDCIQLLTLKYRIID